MARPNKLEAIPIPEGVSLAEYLARRLNEVGSMEPLAVELGVSYATLYNTCQKLGVQKRTEYYVETERMAEAI